MNKRDLNRDEAQLYRNELSKDPHILAVLLKDAGYSFNGAKISGDSLFGFANMTVDPSFLPVMKIPLVEGRNFALASDSATSVIVNQTFVKRAGWKEPIGQEVIFGPTEHYRVIGVIRDYAYRPLNEAPVGPELLTMRMQQSYGMFYVKIKPGSETASLGAIESTFKRLFPLTPFSYVFKDEENKKSYEAEKRWEQIFLFASILTIFISCIGLFGLSVFSVERRIKEIGVRKVLGASEATIATLVSKDFLLLVIVSLLIAMPAAWIGAGKWLEQYPNQVPLSGWMLACAGGIVVFIALATVSFQSVRAAMMNPVDSLRNE